MLPCLYFNLSTTFDLADHYIRSLVTYDIVLYLNSFSKSETYLVNFTNAFSSPDDFVPFQEADKTTIICGWYHILKFPITTIFPKYTNVNNYGNTQKFKYRVSI